VIVKICGITNRDDAEAAVEAGATAIGFNFYRESPRYISPTGAAMIGEALNVTRVGVFVNEPAANVAKIVLEANLDVAQLHGTSQALGIRTWRACSSAEVTVAGLVLETGLLDVGRPRGTSQASGAYAIARMWRASHTEEIANNELAEAVLLDTPSTALYGGTGETHDWSLAKGLPYQVIVAGGLDAGNVALAIQQSLPWGVDACSRLESAPGVKDHEKMQQFVRAALAAAAMLNL